MPGLVPGIHVLPSPRKTWMAGTSPAMTVLVCWPIDHRIISATRPMALRSTSSRIACA